MPETHCSSSNGKLSPEPRNTISGLKEASVRSASRRHTSHSRNSRPIRPFTYDSSTIGQDDLVITMRRQSGLSYIAAIAGNHCNITLSPMITTVLAAFSAPNPQLTTRAERNHSSHPIA